jgi:hypothetical protein
LDLDQDATASPAKEQADEQTAVAKLSAEQEETARVKGEAELAASRAKSRVRAEEERAAANLQVGAVAAATALRVEKEVAARENAAGAAAVSKLQTQVACAAGASTLARTATDSLKRSFDTFASEMRAYMGTHGKKTKHASPFAPDNQVSKSTLEDRHRQRQWWGLDIDEFDAWIDEMRRRKTLGGVYLAELKPPPGWQINRTDTRAQALPPALPPADDGVAAHNAMFGDDDDDDDDDDERDEA